MPQPFLDIAFPGSVGRGATGGPGFSTQIVTLASGAEQRNVNWSQARGRWNISTGIRSRADMAVVGGLAAGERGIRVHLNAFT